jgi:hypothetical protein
VKPRVVWLVMLPDESSVPSGLRRLPQASKLSSTTEPPPLGRKDGTFRWPKRWST